MRLISVVALIAALVACSPPQAKSPPATAVAARGNAPATSADALAAKAVVGRYFAALDAKDYAAARKFWGSGGAESGGDVAAFKASFAPFSQYRPHVGAPTEIKARDGAQYVAVQASVDVVVAGTGRVAKREGAVLLRRSQRPDDPDPTKRDWTIWGSDLRERH